MSETSTDLFCETIDSIDRSRLILPEFHRIYLMHTTDSTNAVCKRLAARNETDCLVLTEQQTAGRGRLGRRFASPQESGIYMSALLHPDLGQEELTCLTTAAAVAVARAIRCCCSRKAEIKWVNDILISGRKVCGILCESGFLKGRPAYSVLGIGINYSLPPGGFPQELREIAGSIYDTPRSAAERTDFIRTLWQEFFSIYRALPSREYMEDYRKFSCLLDADITFLQNGEPQFARVLGIDDDAHLRIRTFEGERSLYAGEVSVRPLNFSS